MFLGFLLFLRSGGLKVTLHDWMSLIEGLHQGLHGQSFHGFYILCRMLLVKTESDLDKFDEMFHRYFKTVDPVKISQEIRELTAQPDVAARNAVIMPESWHPVPVIRPISALPFRIT